MTKKILYLICTCVCMGTAMNTYSQISVREARPTTEQNEPSNNAFDGSTNLISVRIGEHPIGYSKYIGQQLFFLPRARNYTPRWTSSDTIRPITFLFTEPSRMVMPRRQTTLVEQSTQLYMACGNETCRDSVENRFFTILDIRGRTSLRGSSFKRLEDFGERETASFLEFKLRNESNGNILFWRVATSGTSASLNFERGDRNPLRRHYLSHTNRSSNSNMPFLLVSYFEKQRQLFLNQNFVVRDENEIRRLDRGTFRLMDMTRMIDINTGDTVRLDPGEMWTCVDVTLMDSEYQYYFTPFLIFRNEDREIRFRFESRDINDFFMLEAEHLERVAVEEERRRERKQAEEERMRLAEEGRVAAEEERVRLRNEHIRRWGSDLGNTIADGGVRIGMTKEMAIAAWGEPTRINRTTTRHGRREQWVYGGRNNLYFENGILTAIQN